MLDDSNLNSVLALAELSFPAEFIEAMRAYRDQDRLARLGLMASPHEIAEFVQPSFSKWPFRGEGFLPFMHSNSNYVFVGCGQKFRGAIAANGVILTDDLGGLTHENVHGFLGMLDATSNHEHANCIELLASVKLYDVIRDQRIIVEADQKIEELLEGDPSGAWWYLPEASEELCKGLLEVDDFHMQKAAAWRLGRFGSASALEPLQKLANTVVPRGHVNQHVKAAKRAVEQIRRRSSAAP